MVELLHVKGPRQTCSEDAKGRALQCAKERSWTGGIEGGEDMIRDYTQIGYRAAYATSVVDNRDDVLWHNAVADLNMELKDMAETCNCSCGQRGCVATKGAWKSNELLAHGRLGTTVYTV